jgi:hypothetical protein
MLHLPDNQLHCFMAADEYPTGFRAKTPEYRTSDRLVPFQTEPGIMLSCMHRHAAWIVSTVWRYCANVPPFPPVSIRCFILDDRGDENAMPANRSALNGCPWHNQIGIRLVHT